MYNSSLEKLWLSLDSKLKWKTKQETLNSSDLERNISFSHLSRKLLGKIKMYWENFATHRLPSVHCCRERIY